MIVPSGVTLDAQGKPVLRQHVAGSETQLIESGIGPDTTGRKSGIRARLSAEAVHTLALASQTSGRATAVRWCLVSDDAKGRLHVRKVAYAATRSDALRAFGDYPTDWFVTSAASLDTMGAMPVPTRCKCGEFVGESETYCERCRATVRRKGAA